MKYCTQCGTRSSDAARFCTACGTKFEAPALSEAAEVFGAPPQPQAYTISPPSEEGPVVSAASPAREAEAETRRGGSSAVTAAEASGSPCAPPAEASQSEQQLGQMPPLIVYYYLDNENQPIGPHTTKELADLEKKGAITGMTLVASEGDKEWKPWQAIIPARDHVGNSPNGTSSEEAPGVRIEVAEQSGAFRSFALLELRESILQGRTARGAKVRKIVVDKEGTRTESAWTSMDQLGTSDTSLRDLYRPVWHSTMKYAVYGAIGGVIIKALDTTVTLFSANDKVGFAWLVIIAALLFGKKWPLAPVLAILVCIRIGSFQLLSSLSMALFMTMVVGAVFGTPAGMIVGTIVGHFKAPSMPKAPDAAPEGWQPYRWGLLLPLLALAVLVPLYIWLIMKILNG